MIMSPIYRTRSFIDWAGQIFWPCNAQLSGKRRIRGIHILHGNVAYSGIQLTLAMPPLSSPRHHHDAAGSNVQTFKLSRPTCNVSWY